MVFLKTRPMFAPRLRLAPNKTRMRELQVNILEIARECLPHQSLDVLEDERLWPEFAHRAHRFREHISIVQVTAMLSAEGERLARRAAGNHHDLIAQLLVVKNTYVALIKGPSLHRMNMLALVF